VKCARFLPRGLIDAQLKFIVLIADGGILTDFVEADMSVLGLIAKHLGPLQVPSLILPQVKKLDGPSCKRLGLEVIECTAEQLLEAGFRNAGLSFEDRICIILARDGNSACVTNEVVLQKACAQIGIATLGGPDLIVELRRRLHISASKAEKILRALHSVNPYHITKGILTQYQRTMGQLTK
jgi:hypothetical protein